MNNDRRNRLKKAKELLLEAQDIVYDVLNEEDNAYNNLSEGLQCTLKGEQMETNIDTLDEIKDKIDEAIDSLDEIE